MNTISTFLRRVLGRGWVAGLLFLATLLMFGYLVPTQIAGITQNGALTPKILDEHMMGWSAADASTLFEAIGATGREAYRSFYLSLDFWFPVLTAALFMISVLSLVFPAGSAGSRLNLVPLGFSCSTWLRTSFTSPSPAPIPRSQRCCGRWAPPSPWASGG